MARKWREKHKGHYALHPSSNPLQESVTGNAKMLRDSDEMTHRRGKNTAFDGAQSFSNALRCQ